MRNNIGGMTHNPDCVVDLAGQQMQSDVDWRDLVINRKGQKGPTLRVCAQIRKCRGANITGEVLIPLLGNHHDYLSFLSVTH